jgi:hypothetical protein
MTIDSSAFISGLLGNTIPGLLVAVLLLWLNNRSSKSIESYKNELSGRLSEVQHTLTKESAKSKLWHERRVEALIEIYGAFTSYLHFLRQALYLPESKVPMDPYFEFRETLDENLLFLDDELGQFIITLSGELLLFWNWAHRQKREPGITNDEVQRRLDNDIPAVLERLRVRVNEYADPDYRRESRVGG